MRAPPPPPEQCWACGFLSAPHCDAASFACHACAAIIERHPPQTKRTTRKPRRAQLLPVAVFALTCALAYLGLVHLLPHAVANATALLLLRGFSCLLAAAVLGHYVTTLTAARTYPHPRQPRGWTAGGQDSSRGLRYCRLCDVVKPFSSHHCRRCGFCVADRQHHCPFLGVCVGLTTLRPFLCFLATAACGAALALAVCAAMWWRRKTELLLSAFDFHSSATLSSNLHLASRGEMVLTTVTHLARGAAHVGRQHADWLLPLGIGAPMNALVLLGTSTLFVRTVRTTMAGMEDQPAAGLTDIEGCARARGEEPGWVRRSRLRKALLGSEAWGAVAVAFWAPRVGPPGGSRAARLLGLDKTHDA